MRFSIVNDTYRVSKITGPSHNLLGLVFSENDEEDVQSIVDLRQCSSSNLDADLICQYVNQGIAEANQQFGVSYAAKTIQYVGDDTPPEDRYLELAFRIVERLSGGENYSSM